MCRYLRGFGAAELARGDSHWFYVDLMKKLKPGAEAAQAGRASRTIPLVDMDNMVHPESVPVPPGPQAPHPGPARNRCEQPLCHRQAHPQAAVFGEPCFSP